MVGGGAGHLNHLPGHGRPVAGAAASTGNRANSVGSNAQLRHPPRGGSVGLGNEDYYPSYPSRQMAGVHRAGDRNGPGRLPADLAAAPGGRVGMSSSLPGSHGGADAGQRAGHPLLRQSGSGTLAGSRNGGGDLDPPQRAAPVRSLDRRFSGISESTLGKLEQYAQEFDGIEAGMGQIEQLFREKQVLPGKANSELAQLEAKLDRLQCNGVDSIETFELVSGKEQARALRKELTKRAEQLHDKMDALFKEIKEDMQASPKLPPKGAQW
eukprot:gnl/TRDRNA2_/TRDRNA2_83246_c0_seq1.p1 gnl/TRDRNA2_/TRDRNA2_83246_c0~~gnl/TRDRNA2_/TRDRNA2_83246_c0_seq1.p1  ORF type:complete len:314 (-),score=59.34 gnl/TRDRNA2_/TRDRNA2_83246_c0_seq1:127-930(-)